MNINEKNSTVISRVYLKDKEYINSKFGPTGKSWSEQVPNIAKSNNEEKYPKGYIIEPPTEDPIKIYNERSSKYASQQESLPEKYAQLPPEGQGVEREHSLYLMKNYFSDKISKFTGYQCIEQMNISNDIAPFLNMSLNNLGDPFENGYFTLNAKQAERGVLDFYASIWHAKWPSLTKPPRIENVNNKEYFCSQEYINYKESYWGYILSMGSTEGNLYAVLSARDYLSGFSLVVDEEEEALYQPNVLLTDSPNKYIPVAFYSEAAHYSLAKAVHAMKVKTYSQIAYEKNLAGEDWKSPVGDQWPESVPVDEFGRVKINELVKLVSYFVEKGFAPFICFNYGTTFKGAYDNVPEVCSRLKPIFETYNLNNREVEYLDSEGNIKIDYRRAYWIHVDGAVGASLMPFVEMGVEHKQIQEKELAPSFDFRNEEVMSIVTSGHKWPGASAPTGIYMTKNKYLITPISTPDYLGSADTTFAGSRNGLSAIMLWNLIAKEGVQGMVEKAKITMDLCSYTYNKFEQLQKQLGSFDIWLKRAPNGGTSIIFRKPTDEIMFKYSLPLEIEKTETEGGLRKQTYVHLFIFWDRNKAMLDSLINELKSESAFDTSADIFIADKKDNKNIKRPMRVLKKSIHKSFR